MSTEHSPTPYSNVFDAERGQAKLWADTDLVGIIYQQGSADSAKTNADFIVRACNSHGDLFAALWKMLAFNLADRRRHQAGCPTHSQDVGCTCGSAEARAAIAKAEEDA